MEWSLFVWSTARRRMQQPLTGSLALYSAIGANSRHYRSLRKELPAPDLPISGFGSIAYTETDFFLIVERMQKRNLHCAVRLSA